ncbi:hypothetical protein C8F01DRAFT_1157925 [Mycena amicta]|nr:hypothetical protein C8F01DRAFT_1157925 [Mycena amicta]
MRLVIFDARSELRVVEALRAGLLRTLVEYASTGHHLRGLMLDDARYLLATVIGEHCVYLSVLRALPVAFAEIAELNPAQHFDRVGLGEEWADCEQFVRERLAVVDVYSTGTLSCWRACDNTECGFLGDKRGLKRCAGCQDAWFCSRECQKVDWDNGHRKNCKILRDSLIEYSSNLKPRDRAFHRALLNFDHAAHEEEHIALLVPLMNRTAPLTSTMDYSGGRMQTKISPAGATHDGSFQVLKQRAQRAGDRTQLSWMYYMQGSTVRMRGVLRRFAEPDLYEGLREYAATREGLEEPEKIIMDSRRIPELAVLAGKCTY